MSGLAEGWRPDPVALAAFLRRRGLRVGVGEMLRALGVLDRVAVFGRRPETPEEAARWLTPVLCNTVRHQAAFSGWLREFELSGVPREPRPTSTRSTSVPPPVAPQPRWLPVAALVMVALVLAGLWFLPGGPAAVTAPALTPAPLALPAAGTDWPRWLNRLFASIPAALVPPLVALCYVRWRGPDVPVLARRAFQPTRTAQLATKDGAPFLFAGRETTDALRALRTHRRVPDTRPDLRASLRATLRAAGQPILASGFRPRMPEYPLLIEVLSSRDHVLALAHLLSARLTDETVHHALFQFGADPLRLRDGRGAILTLADIAARYDYDVLLMVGDGESLIDPIQLTMLPWTEVLTGWRAVVLLTPVPRRRWSWRERRLAEGGIIVLPLTPDGLARLAEFLRAGTRPPRLAFERAPVRPGLLAREGRHAWRFHTDDIPGAGEREAVLDAIQQELPGPAFEVLAITALFPECRPDLTLHLGRERGLLTEESFGALAALPWFRYGRLPDWLRLDLVQTLSEPQLDASREVFRRWIGTEAAIDAGGLWIATAGKPDPASLIGAARNPIRDVIYLRLDRRESLATLDLQAPGDLERLARPLWRSPATLAMVVGAIGCGATLLAGSAAGGPFAAALLDDRQSLIFMIAAFSTIVLGTAAGLLRLAVGPDRTSRLFNVLPLGSAALAAALGGLPFYFAAANSFDNLTIGAATLPCVALGLLGPGRGIAAAGVRLGGTLPLAVVWLAGFALSLSSIEEMARVLQPVVDGPTSTGLVLQALACALFYARTCRARLTPIAWAATIGFGCAFFVGLTIWLPFTIGTQPFGAELIIAAAPITVPFACALALVPKTAASLRPVLLLFSIALTAQIGLAMLIPALPLWGNAVPPKLAGVVLGTAAVVPVFLVFLLHAAIGASNLRPSWRNAKWIAATVLGGLALSSAALACWIWQQPLLSGLNQQVGANVILAVTALSSAAALMVRRVRRFLIGCSESLFILLMWTVTVHLAWPSWLALAGLYLPMAWVAAGRFGQRAFWVVAWGGASFLVSTGWQYNYANGLDLAWTGSDLALLTSALTIVALRTEPRFRLRLPDLRRLGWAELIAAFLLGQVLLTLVVIPSNLPSFRGVTFFVYLVRALELWVLLYAAVGGSLAKIATAAAASAAVAWIVAVRDPPQVVHTVTFGFAGDPVAVLLVPLLMFAIGRLWAHQLRATADPAIPMVKPWAGLFLIIAIAALPLLFHPLAATRDPMVIAATAAIAGLLRLALADRGRPIWWAALSICTAGLVALAWSAGRDSLYVWLIGAAWLGDRVTFAALEQRHLLPIFLQPIRRVPALFATKSLVAKSPRYSPSYKGKTKSSKL